MKIFALYTNLTLYQKPTWFDEFRVQYDEPCELHITLIQPRFIEEGDIPALKELVSAFFAKMPISAHKIDVTFGEVSVKSGLGAIMLVAKDGGTLARLQKNLRTLLSAYRTYTDPLTQSYEENFEPHVTIGKNLSEDRYQEALRILKGDVICVGIVDEIVFPIVRQTTLEEACNPANQTRYRL